MKNRVLKGVTKKIDAWAAERGLTFFPNKTVSIIFRKRNEEKWYPRRTGKLTV